MEDDAPNQQSTCFYDLLLILFLLQLASIALDLQNPHLSSLPECRIQEQTCLAWSPPISTVQLTWLASFACSLQNYFCSNTRITSRMVLLLVRPYQ
jgi:hypothetical protein